MEAQETKTNESQQNNMNVMDMYKKAQSLIQMANGNPKEAFYSLCRMKGLDPNTVLKQLGLLQ